MGNRSLKKKKITRGSYYLYRFYSGYIRRSHEYNTTDFKKITVSSLEYPLK